MDDQRRQWIRNFVQTVDWNAYDYTHAPGADMSFPDLAEGEVRHPWVSKHYNATSGMRTCHVLDLNDIRSGAERRLYALYGVPVEWDDENRQSIIAAIEAARAQGGAAFAATLSHYGMVNEEHFRWIQDRRKPSMEAARREAQKTLDAQREAQKQEQQQRMQGELKGELAPVEGISLEAWASIQARVASGGDVDAILASSGIDRGRWDRVSAEWNARMSRDQTATIATAYGRAFMGAGQGQYGAAAQQAASAMNPGGAVVGQEPIPFERWIEITEAQAAAGARGTDAIAVLRQYGMSPADWGSVSGWWSQKFAANAMNMLDDYNRLSAKYRAKFQGG